MKFKYTGTCPSMFSVGLRWCKLHYGQFVVLLFGCDSTPYNSRNIKSGECDFSKL